MIETAACLTIAAAQYPIEFLGDWQRYQEKLTGWVERAVAQGARLLVFPEYASLELASLFPPEVQRSLPGQLEALQDCLPHYRELHRELARRHGVHIVAGSFPVRQEDGSYRNRAYFFSPEGALDYQDKLLMTRFEDEQWGISGSNVLKVFETAFGRIGITICYDSEFPLIARALVEAGAELLLAPSCTETLAGYHRVRIGCQARALENQCYTVQAPTVGEAPWSPAVDLNTGAAAIYAPPDQGLPDSGVVVQGELNVPQWVIGEIDLERVRRVRRDGNVLNHRDWPLQVQRTGGEVVAVRL
ncbi:MAG TPA: carbon-nitrogen hydrolase family protein [Candidatus Competibacteraceae bacterium]|nr:carbon-nitrogen hydrolase family protein [Candidatus Competibacteraceae bacterium]